MYKIKIKNIIGLQRFVAFERHWEMLMIYNFIRYILYIILGIVSIFNRKLRLFLRKRLFQNYKLGKGSYYWVHCASVGEVNLSEPLIRGLMEKSENKILLTMMTDTGMATAKGKYASDPRVEIRFFPIDDHLAITSILKNIRLEKLIIVETEIWPNLIKLSSKVASIVMVNGRISDKSFGAYSKFKFYLKGLFKRIDMFLMQTQEDSERILALGAAKDKVENVGNLKFDIDLEDFTEKEIEKIKRAMNIIDRKIFVAGSTRDDEEEHVLEAFDEVKDKYLMLLVPRHIERSDDICSRLLDGRYNYKRWSELDENKKIDRDIEIILVDGMGLLRRLYAMADIVFVGGTLVDIGGHSLLEPLYYRKTPIFGPYLQNVREISREILKRGIGYRVEDKLEFVEAIRSIEKSCNIEESIEDFFETNTNATHKAIERIIDIS